MMNANNANNAGSQEPGEARAGRIVLAHGGGGELTRRLLAERIIPKIANDLLAPLADSAVIDAQPGRLCLTTDAFVVQPLEFAGGDIGRLAVCGTVNDLAVMGAKPLALSLALVLEEGLGLDVLDRVMDSIAAAAGEAGVVIATGDTKVVEHHGDGGMTVTTAGIGTLPPDMPPDATTIAAGDAVIVTGLLAEHGLAVMSARKGLGIRTTLASDVAPLGGLIEAMLASGGRVKFMRDPTRGGLAGLLADLSEQLARNIEIDEQAVPLSPAARHASELLGLDPLTVANEGKVVAVVAANDAEKVIAACRAHPLGAAAAIVGRIAETSDWPLVELLTAAGGRRIVQRPYGEELPRIC